MSIKDNSIVHPGKFINYLKESGRLEHERSPEVIIFIFLPHLVNACLDKYDLSRVKGFDTGDLFTFNNVASSLGLFCCSGVGAPVAVINMEELIAFGAKKFIVVGTVGALQKALDIADLMVCSEAIIDEGTSKHYVADGITSFPSTDWHNNFVSYLTNERVPFSIGKSWSTDAPYRETVEKVIELQRQSVLSVEMEISALFTLAKFYNVEITTLLTISDSLANLDWTPGFFSDKVTKSLLLSLEHAIIFSNLNF